MSGFHTCQTAQQSANPLEQKSQDPIPHISYQKSDEILPTLDRLHVSIDLHPPRVEVGPSVIAQINPLPP
jgi:hypothetical protein